MITALFCLVLGAPPDAEAAYERAVALRRAKQHAKAADAFEAVADSHPASRIASQALVAAASIRRTQLGQTARALALYQRAARGPDDVPGQKAALLGWTAIERARGGPRAELRTIESLYASRPESDLAPWLLIRAARIFAEDLARPNDALAPLVRVRESHSSSKWIDEAAMAEGDLLRELRRPEEALRAYRKILAVRRDSFLVGEYDSELIDDALFAVAEVLERELGKREDAAQAYRELLREKPESILAAEALARAERLTAPAR